MSNQINRCTISNLTRGIIDLIKCQTAFSYALFTHFTPVPMLLYIVLVFIFMIQLH